MYSWDNAQVVLVGNKCDLEQDRAVTQDRGKRLADQLGNSFDVVSRSSILFRFVFSLSCCFSRASRFVLFAICCVVYSRVLQIKTHSWEKTPVILIGNKCDMANERVVRTEEGKKLADVLGKVFLARFCTAFS